MRQIIKKILIFFPFLSRILIEYNYVLYQRTSIFTIKKRIKTNTLLKDYNLEQKKHWEERISKTISSPDNENIIHCNNAGKLIKGLMILHNQLKSIL